MYSFIYEGLTSKEIYISTLFFSSFIFVLTVFIKGVLKRFFCLFVAHTTLDSLSEQIKVAYC